MNARQCVLKILEDFEKNTAQFDSILDETLCSQGLDQRDKRLVIEIVYGILRNKLSLDFVLNQFLKERYFTKNRLLMHILRIGAYQILYLDRIPDHAAVNESVLLAKDNENTRNVSGVVNAVLRKIIKYKKNLPKPDKDEQLDFRLSINYSHPGWMVKRWLNSFGLSNTKKVLEFNNTRPDVFLRRRFRGLPRQQFESDALSIADTVSGGTGYKNLYYRLKKHILPENIRLLKDGLCTVQAVSSGWVVGLLDIKDGDKILDVCSAPGGKTSLLSELTGKKGAVCACELRFSRLRRIKEIVYRMNLPNVYMIVCNGEKLPFTGYYDKVLLDVPCSGTGVMHRHPDARWHRKEEDIERVAKVQERLLEGAAPHVNPQGILVYATCSIEPEENQQQVDNFLKRHPEFVLEKPFGLIKDTYIDKNGFLFITPFEHKMDGMFAARMRKI